MLSLARLLDRRRDLTVVTNSLMAAATLMTLPHRLILVGGEFRPISRTLVGPLTASVIQSVHVNKAFMGTIGFTFRDGMTTTDPQEAFTKEQISPARDTRLRWMQSVLHCTHYIAGAGEKAYLRTEDAPEITYINRDPIDRADEACTEIST